MLQKPNGYDDAAAFTGEFETLPPGGYVCRIRAARQDETRSGRPMLVLAFDVSEGKYNGYFQRMYDRAREKGYQSVKWRGTVNQLMDGSSIPFFKGMITAIEQSNPGYVFNWDENTLAGKLFGGVFGREEYIASDGKPRMATRCMFVRSVDAVRNGVEPPADKLLSSRPMQQPSQRIEEFTAVNDEELPF